MPPRPHPVVSTAVLTVRLFGPGEAFKNDVPLSRTRTRKEMWLLAILLLRSGKVVDRVWLAGLLWPESLERDALSNLRRSLSNLRDVLGEHARYLTAPTARTVCFDAREIDVDMLAFDAAVAYGDISALREAVALYRGPFLEGCLEPWAFPERELREQAYLTALETLAAHALTRQDWMTAVRYLRLVTSLDPFRETALQNLLEALMALGDKASAILAYRRFRLRLHLELRADPAPKTTDIYHKLLTQNQNLVSVPLLSPLSNPPTAVPWSLPRPLTPLIGRQREIETLVGLLDTVHLLSLLGPGGVGKTRLAIAVAEATGNDFADGVCFVDLASLSDPSLVTQAVASLLGIMGEPHLDLLTTLRNALSSRSLLLILDNCEHLIEPCAQLAHALLNGCPHLRLLTTSRQPLGIAGEKRRRIPALHVPDSLPELPYSEALAALLRSEAIQLFVERASWNETTFCLTPENMELVIQICRRLDGIPLAIELAAACVQTMTVAQIAARLGDRFRLLTGGSRTALPHQKTLQTTMDWSYRLLPAVEQLLLCRLTVFARGWTLEAAEQVCCAEEGVGSRDLDPLTALVDKSLVVYTRENGGRYHLLETVHQYALARLKASEDYVSVRHRHVRYFLEVAEETAGHWDGPEQGLRLQSLYQEKDNLRAALEWCQSEDGDTAIGLRLGTALWRFWRETGDVLIGSKHLTTLLRKPDAVPLALRAGALYAAGCLFAAAGDARQAWPDFEDALRMARDLGDRALESDCLFQLGVVARDRSEFETANSLLSESLEIQRTFGEKPRLAGLLGMLGGVARDQEQYAKATGYYMESLALCREVQDQWGMVYTLKSLGSVAHHQGDYETAHTYYQRSLTLWRQENRLWGIAYALNSLGTLALDQDDLTAARSFLRESLTIRRDLQDRWAFSESLGSLALLAARQQQFERAARLAAASDQIRRSLGCILSPREQAEQEACIQSARAALGDIKFTVCWEEATRSSTEHVVRDALADEASGL